MLAPGRFALLFLELATLSLLIVASRCANYREVFINGRIYFTDADCYARMTRVRLCAEHPGLVLRHHEFENYPSGTTPHTTTPLDYLIIALSLPLGLFSTEALDLAGALISPLLAVLTGWFLWWWLRRMQFRYGWVALILYVNSPILVHGTESGRPDHQSLLILLLAAAICGEWACWIERDQKWSVLSAASWSLALWVSAYEPLVLLFLLLISQVLSRWDVIGRFGIGTSQRGRHRSGFPSILFVSKERFIGSVVFFLILALAFAVERRLPGVPVFRTSEDFKNWSRTIGELRPVPPLSSIWFSWAGYGVPVVPLLLWIEWWKDRRRSGLLSKGQTGAPEHRDCSAIPFFVIVLLCATYCLTVSQARWAYFFVLIFAIALPGLSQPVRSAPLVWVALAASLFPVLRSWDNTIWPNDSETARKLEARMEAVQLRELSLTLRAQESRPFVAPWWLSPAITYWSEQPGVAGSSHESLPGIVDSARLFLSDGPLKAREILENRGVNWVVAYDADRTAAVSGAILGQPVPEHALCYILDRAPNHAPPFLVLSAQSPTAKLFRVTTVADERGKLGIPGWESVDTACEGAQ